MNQYQACLDSLNAFFTRIPNIVTKFYNFDIFYQICYILGLLSAHARRIVSVKGEVWSIGDIKTLMVLYQRINFLVGNSKW